MSVCHEALGERRLYIFQEKKKREKDSIKLLQGDTS